MSRTTSALALLILVTTGCGDPGDRASVAATASESAALSWSHGRGDPTERGPYVAGYTSYLLYDSSRPGGRPDDATYESTGRPIAVSVFYPASRHDARHAPAAGYELDPYYGRLAPMSSHDLEAQGFDPAVAEPPVAHGRFPVVIFSSGASAPDFFHISLGTRLASHGFVVVIPYHFGIQWWMWEPLWDNLAVLSYDRPRDMSFILDDLLRRDHTHGDLFHRHIDRDEVVAGGWSLGGYAAMVMAGGDDSVCDTFYGLDVSDPPEWTCAPTPPDPRVKALLLVDGSSQLLHWSELQRVEVPALAMGETWDMIGTLFGPGMSSWQARQHAAMSGHPSFRVDVLGAVHASFGDICEVGRVLKAKGVEWWSPWDDLLIPLCGPDLISSSRMHELMNAYSVAFLKTYVQHEPGYRYWLTSHYARDHVPDVYFFEHERCEPPVPTPDWPPDWVYYQTPEQSHGPDQCPE